MNKELSAKCAKIGVHFPEIMIPEQNVEMEKWSVVACDQYTSQEEYWKDVEEIVGDSPSTLHLILPELYLERPDVEARIQKIYENMRNYINNQIFQTLPQGVILVEREILNGKVRKGVVLAVDLESYDFKPSSRSLIRATEKTVVERIPPRIKVRNQALLESPHILILIDDPGFTVVEQLHEKLGEACKVYDFELMKNSGRIKGYFTSNEQILKEMVDALSALIEPEAYRKKYDLNRADNGMLFAMGDGNHSLATAKTHWENVKQHLSDEELQTHPARFALIEMMNLHDPVLEFEPIHRVVFRVDTEAFLKAMVEATPGSFYQVFPTEPECNENIREYGNRKHCIPFVTKKGYGFVHLEDSREMLGIAAFERAYGLISEKFPSHSIDFIHGEQSMKELSQQPGNIGFKMPTLHKNELFKYVLENGVLPKKTFSMGEADEKRFYLECRKIVKEI